MKLFLSLIMMFLMLIFNDEYLKILVSLQLLTEY